MEQIHRRRTALFLVVIYCCILLTPLSALAMQSNHWVRAVIGECSEDCNLCGCSPVARSSHTCCCWRKKRVRLQEKEIRRPVTPDCCYLQKKHPNPDEGHLDGEEPMTEETIGHIETKRQIVTTCGCPCGNDKSSVLSSVTKYEQFPVELIAFPTKDCAETMYFSFRPHRADRHCEPPDPPPKISTHC